MFVVRGYEHVSAGVLRGQKRVAITLELRSQVFVSNMGMRN